MLLLMAANAAATDRVTLESRLVEQNCIQNITFIRWIQERMDCPEVLYIRKEEGIESILGKKEFQVDPMASWLRTTALL